MALTLGRNNLILRLVERDVHSEELFYHKSSVKPCLAQFHRDYNNVLSEKKKEEQQITEEWVKLSALNRVYLHMWEQKAKGVTTFHVVCT